MPDRKKLDLRLGELTAERETWIAHWRELSDYFAPYRSRFLVTDRNKGHKRGSKIINGTARYAVRTLASGMMAGITSPARPWFRLAVPDQDLMELESVKMWTDAVAVRMRAILNASNLYTVLPSLYADMGVFGQSPMIPWFDFKTVVRFEPYVIGEYMLAANSHGKIDTLYRRLQMTVQQLVERFGDTVSPSVRNMYDQSRGQSWVTIIHAVEPNDDRMTGFADRRNMPWRSVFYEEAADDGKFLEVSGFEENPILGPRWDVVGLDSYGSGPGMDALGDQKQLQIEEKSKVEGIQKIVRPPLKAPGTMKNAAIAGVPGGVSYYSSVTPGDERGLSPLYEVNLRLGELFQDIRGIEDRLRRAFYEDLFLMLASSDRREMTATEVAERHEEKLIALGPVLERLHSELLDPLIDRVFGIMVRASKDAWRLGTPALIPPPPPELQGMPLKIEYISIMAQAQKALGIGSLERLIGFVGNLASFSADVLDKVDLDQSVDEYAQMLGVGPRIILSDERATQARQERAQAEQAAAAMAATQESVGAAKALSEVDTGGKNALTDIIGQQSA